MGFAMARAASRMGGNVTLISGPTALPSPPFISTIRVRTAEEMFNAVSRASADADVVVMVAAVADFKAKKTAAGKIRKEEFDYKVELTPTIDILETLGKDKGKRFLVGFAAETDDLARNAREKMKRKNLDAIVANDVSRTDIGFESDDNEVRIFFPDGEILELPLATKDGIAAGVWLALNRKLFRR
jgi:phosphopantothenoylcysteine decarboxylase/phosphopantothenate--cysteine ligase